MGAKRYCTGSIVNLGCRDIYAEMCQPPKDSTCHASKFSRRILHSQAVRYACVVASWAPTSRYPPADVCGHLNLHWKSLGHWLWLRVPRHACAHAHTGSPAASPPHQRALACTRAAVEAGQLSQLHLPRAGKAVTLPSDTNFVILVFSLTASHPWPLSVGQE